MKKAHIIALVIIAAGFAVIVAMISKSSQYATFSQATSNEGITYHVIGQHVKEKGVEFDPYRDVNTFSFYMIDEEGEENKVVCNGDKPQDFELSEEIVVVGKMKDDVFHATSLLTKCPSKYVDEDIGHSTEPKGA